MVHHNSLENKPKKKKQRVSSKKPKRDKISSLPTKIVDNILSNLSIRDAVRTSILSKNWRYKWTTVPSLVFDNECFSHSFRGTALGKKKKLVRIIYHVLLFHKGPIQKFKISHEDFEGVSDIDRWIVFISKSVIEEFILDMSKGKRYQPPSCLFSFENLTHLKLSNCTLKPSPTFKGFKSLKSLDLRCITVSQDVLENLTCGCPLLESLILMKFGGFTNLNIDAPNLEYIYAWGVLYSVSLKNTFNLTSVSIGFDEKINYIHDKPEEDESSSELLRFFANLPHIQQLSIQNYFLGYLARGDIPSSLPTKLVELNDLNIHIDFNDLDNMKAAQCLLRSSPNLQELKISATPKPDEELGEGTYTNLWGDELWSSLFTHLRVATMNEFSGFKAELDFISFLLSNAPALEKMTVKPVSLDTSLVLVKELLRFKKASLDVEVDLLDP